MTKRAKLPLPARLGIGLAVAAAVLVVGCHVVLPLVFFPRSAGIVVRNGSGRTVSDVKVGITPAGRSTQEASVPSMKPNSSRRFSTQATDTQVRLVFVLDGQEYVYDGGTDLWPGDTFIFEVQPDGGISSHYAGTRGD